MPRELFIQTSKPASAKKKAIDFRPSHKMPAHESIRPCWYKMTGFCSLRLRFSFGLENRGPLMRKRLLI